MNSRIAALSFPVPKLVDAAITLLVIIIAIVAILKWTLANNSD